MEKHKNKEKLRGRFFKGRWQYKQLCVSTTYFALSQLLISISPKKTQVLCKNREFFLSCIYKAENTKVHFMDVLENVF